MAGHGRARDFLRDDGVEHADYGPLYARMGHS